MRRPAGIFLSLDPLASFPSFMEDEMSGRYHLLKKNSNRFSMDERSMAFGGKQWLFIAARTKGVVAVDITDPSRPL